MQTCWMFHGNGAFECSCISSWSDEHTLTFFQRRLLDIDDFIENLWKIHVQVKSEGYVQVYLAIAQSATTIKLTPHSPYNSVCSDPITWSTSTNPKALNPASSKLNSTQSPHLSAAFQVTSRVFIATFNR